MPDPSIPPSFFHDPILNGQKVDVEGFVGEARAETFGVDPATETHYAIIGTKKLAAMAAEIERLRDERDAERALADRLAEALPPSALASRMCPPRIAAALAAYDEARKEQR